MPPKNNSILFECCVQKNRRKEAICGWEVESEVEKWTRESENFENLISIFVDFRIFLSADFALLSAKINLLCDGDFLLHSSEYLDHHYNNQINESTNYFN